MKATYRTKDGNEHEIEFESNAKQWGWKKRRAIEAIEVRSLFEPGTTLMYRLGDFVLTSVDGIPCSDGQPHSAVIEDIPHFHITSRHGTNDCRCYYECDEQNEKGETLLVELGYCYDSGYYKSLPKAWKRLGYTDRVVETYWHFDTYVRDEHGQCYRRYDPTVKPGGAGLVIDFDWHLDATPENALRIFAECYDRFVNARR